MKTPERLQTIKVNESSELDRASKCEWRRERESARASEKWRKKIEWIHIVRLIRWDIWMWVAYCKCLFGLRLTVDQKKKPKFHYFVEFLHIFHRKWYFLVCWYFKAIRPKWAPTLIWMNRQPIDYVTIKYRILIVFQINSFRIFLTNKTHIFTTSKVNG